ncbi:ATP-dependent DNA helicase [Aestuariivita boseongensis]|uniref:ATP-dependent DNA helicase n=1 Tax=Aestuariivita boseongensis TaxID=1470562 RepID=UPI00068312AB|nr:helicase C-terminal domain-containing protein [Aestuariivita boseongensis]
MITLQETGYPLRGATENLLKGGSLTKYLPGFAPRDIQLDLADRIAAVIAAPQPTDQLEGQITLFNAPVGVGKSIAALGPMALHAALTGEQVIISTATIQLQRQLLEEFVRVIAPVTRDLTGVEVTAGTYVGLRNWIDWERLQRVREKENIAELDLWLDAETRPVRFDEAEQIFNLSIPNGVRQEHICLHSGSSDSAKKEYNLACAGALASNVIITNHATMLLDARLYGARISSPEGELPRTVAIFDEADVLPSLAQGMAERQIALRSVARLLDRVEGSEVAKSKLSALWQSMDILEAEKLSVILQHDIPEHLAIREAVDALVEELRTLATEVREDRPILAFDLQSTALDLAEANDEDKNASAGVVYSPVRRYPSLQTVALEPARILGRLWHRPRDGREPILRAMAFMSGTLSVPGEKRPFSDFCRRLGVNDRWSNIAEHRSKNWDHRTFGSCEFVLADRQVPSPWVHIEGQEPERNLDWVAYAKEGIQAARREGGRVLVLTASYDDAIVLSEGLEDALVHERGMALTKLVEAFQAVKDAVLFSPCAWAGVDLPHMVDHVVIPRLPMSRPDELREKVIRAHRLARGRPVDTIGFELMAQSRADAKRRMAQGQGRGIRVRDDHCKVWILDPRFPIPEALRRNLRLRLAQGSAKEWTDFLSVIPERFAGPFGSFRQAKILEASAAKKPTTA